MSPPPHPPLPACLPVQVEVPRQELQAVGQTQPAPHSSGPGCRRRSRGCGRRRCHSKLGWRSGRGGGRGGGGLDCSVVQVGPAAWQRSEEGMPCPATPPGLASRCRPAPPCSSPASLACLELHVPKVSGVLLAPPAASGWAAGAGQQVGAGWAGWGGLLRCVAACWRSAPPPRGQQRAPRPPACSCRSQQDDWEVGPLQSLVQCESDLSSQGGVRAGRQALAPAPHVAPAPQMHLRNAAPPPLASTHTHTHVLSIIRSVNPHCRDAAAAAPDVRVVSGGGAPPAEGGLRWGQAGLTLRAALWRHLRAGGRAPSAARRRAAPSAAPH